MPPPDLTRRERLALDIEHVSWHLHTLIARDLRVTDEEGAPRREDLAPLANVLHRLDAIGASMGPDLYRTAEQRREQIGGDR